PLHRQVDLRRARRGGRGAQHPRAGQHLPGAPAARRRGHGGSLMERNWSGVDRRWQWLSAAAILVLLILVARAWHGRAARAAAADVALPAGAGARRRPGDLAPGIPTPPGRPPHAAGAPAAPAARTLEGK